MSPISRNRVPLAALRAFALYFAVAMAGRAQDVGQGAPSDGIKQRFVNAYFRGNFSNLVSLPANGEVRRLGSTTGLVQEFSDVAKTKGVTYALIRANSSPVVVEGTNDVVQMTPDMNAFFNQQGVNTVGFPTTDTLLCAAPAGAAGCGYQFFDKTYVLVAYKSNGAAQDCAIRNPFYAKWTTAGGINTIGACIDLERSVTGLSSVTATAQIYLSGAIYNITSGTQSGSAFTVLGPAYTFYAANGGHEAFLGLPTSEETTTAEGKKRQTFQGGAIEYTPGPSPTPQVKFPVNSVSLGGQASGGVLRLKLGETANISALLLAPNGTTLTDRQVNWTTTNGRVATVQSSGLTAIVRAAGGGTALIAASSEGKVSPSLQVIVTAPCCQIGEGAPSPAIEQSFQDAVARNGLKVQVPAANPVRRAGAGYVQDLQSAGSATAVRYLIAKPDKLSAAFVIGGEFLPRHEALGGPAGSLGHPISDATAAGRQLFENAALAGTPARVVSGIILTKWANLGYETGAVGLPVEEASVFLTFSSTPGIVQSFRNGMLLGISGGSRAGQAYFVAGPILARYRELNGAAGVFGSPVSDEFATGGLRRQNFEGGYFDYAAGSTSAQAHENERRPSVAATPSAVVAGGRVRVSVNGFSVGATLRVSVTGQPDFVVSTANGAYSWESFIPGNAATASITIRAVEASGTATAQVVYQIRSLADSRVRLSKVRGDAQAGAPGSLLPATLRVRLLDDVGNPVAGSQVAFRASSGALLGTASATTDENGQAETALRLPQVEGITLVTAESAGQVSTFSERAAASALKDFPKLTQAVDGTLGNGSASIAQKGALLAATASLLRHHQNRAELPSPNGPAEVAQMNNYLKTFCALDTQGEKVCDGFLSNSAASGDQVLNLWRAGAFVGGTVDISVENPAETAIRDLVSAGDPVLVVLSLSRDGVAAGGHAVVAIGVAGDGGLLIHDPNPSFGRRTLGDYLAGFAIGSAKWSGTIGNVVRLLPRAPSATGFLLAAPSMSGGTPPGLASGAGACGRPVMLPDTAVATGDVPSVPPPVSFFLYCDGVQPSYQLASDAGYRFTITDLSNGGARQEIPALESTAYSVTRTASQIAVSALATTFSATAVVNAATFGTGIAPGGLMAIFGSGLAGGGKDTSVEMNGSPVRTVAATPFQVNAEVPADLAAGTYSLRIRSSFGVAEQPVNVSESAPGIFLIGGPGRGAVVNQDGKINSPVTAARRGQVVVIYGTGLGSVIRQGNVSVARNRVTALLNGQEFPVAFAGLTPGFIGLYQVNLALPQTAPPGLDLPLAIRQAGVDSNTVLVSVQ
ncbi:MAG: hypothetical protein EXQ52_03385 [Bryobacterales bacterium]|nr:hypothetical protein [Bryobacterales bacterium]